jgi:hypothetical protein
MELEFITLRKINQNLKDKYMFSLIGKSKFKKRHENRRGNIVEKRPSGGSSRQGRVMNG